MKRITIILLAGCALILGSSHSIAAQEAAPPTPPETAVDTVPEAETISPQGAETKPIKETTPIQVHETDPSLPAEASKPVDRFAAILALNPEFGTELTAALKGLDLSNAAALSTPQIASVVCPILSLEEGLERAFFSHITFDAEKFIHDWLEDGRVPPTLIERRKVVGKWKRANMPDNVSLTAFTERGLNSSNGLRLAKEIFRQFACDMTKLP